MSIPASLPCLRIPSIDKIAVPAVVTNILFLSYSSQYLFYYIGPGPLSKEQAICFNSAVALSLSCLDRTITVDAAPRGWIRKSGAAGDEDGEIEGKTGVRWCRKCEAVKPPRAHHCKKCKKCIPKMDHHCPWTTNCVSHTTFPHFLRFIFYGVISMAMLEYFLLERVYILWVDRNLPSYLGPPAWTMAHLLVLLLVNSICLFGLAVLLSRSFYSLATNTTMIESWEIERHEALVNRSRRTGGSVYANGKKIYIKRQEFPYDIGIWKNLCQGMGSSVPILWFFPYAPTPRIENAANWEVNGFEDESTMWPPLDPDKIPRTQHTPGEQAGLREYGSPEEEKEAFRQRQEKDYARWAGRNPAADSTGADDSDAASEYLSEYEEGMDGEEGWTNSEGDRLRDYGVDEEAEIIADDDVPLGELIRRRKARALDDLDL